jgi:uncharacterized membrane protein YoaK (UPF0700 family)
MLGMPTHYLRSLSGQQRRADLNLNLARYLTFVAGAANAGGFLAVQQYTSHMSGIVASIGGNLALGHHQLVLGSLLALLSFLAGAACTAIMVNWGKRKRLHSLFALPLVLESLLLIGFGLVGSSITTVMLLCFLMGLQNALITKISKTEIRTTHVTGIVTDIGIELGKLIYWNDQSLSQTEGMVLASREKMRALFSLLSLFLLGGIVGAFGFQKVGALFTIPLAALLLVLAIVPVWDDITHSFTHPRKSP